MVPDWTLRAEAAMTPEQRTAFLDTLNRLNPNWRGAQVADYLANLIDVDARLDLTEPMYAEHHADVPEPYLLTIATLAIAYSVPGPLSAADIWPSVSDLIERVRAA